MKELHYLAFSRLPQGNRNLNFSWPFSLLLALSCHTIKCGRKLGFVRNLESASKRGWIESTLTLKNVSLPSSVWNKNTLITGVVRGAGADPLTFKMGTFFLIPLTLNMPICNNFQLNGALGETLKLPDPLFCFKKLWGLEVSLHLIGNCC